MEEIPQQHPRTFRWRIGRSCFLASPEAGARLIRWDLEPGEGGGGRPVIYWPTPDAEAAAAEFAYVRGGNPILFPFAARSYVDGAIHRWTDGDTIRPMPLHGIARQSRFQVTAMDETGFSARLCPADEAREIYPFEYAFDVTYAFAATGLTVSLRLTNTGRTPMPWSPGYHFYLAVPWTVGRSREDYTIEIPATRIAREDERGGLTYHPPFPVRSPLAAPALVTAFHHGLTGDGVTLRERDTGTAVTVRLQVEPGHTPAAGFMTWTQDDAVPFYCVEPWMGPPNAMGNRTGVDWVAPGQSAVFAASVELDQA